MSDKHQGDLESLNPGGPNGPGGDDATEPGFMAIEEKDAMSSPSSPSSPLSSIPAASPDMAQAASAARANGRVGTAEHLAARRILPTIDVTTPAIKQQLAELRTDVTDLVTGLRWGGRSVEETATRMMPLLNIGPVPQWQTVLNPFLLEIDRAGNLTPVWVKIIEQGDAPTLPPDGNPAETEQGRARRYAILMLGNYKYTSNEGTKAPLSNVTKLLGLLSLDPNTSLYATQALVNQSTTAAMQVLIEALKNAEGWAKVDVVEACLKLNNTQFYDLLLASGLEHVSGLESYVAVPLYRTIPLEPYLRQQQKSNARTAQQAALVFAQVLQDGMTPPKSALDPLPVAFERPLAAFSHALFDGARSQPTWQHTIAVHRFGTFSGRYWGDISRGVIQDPRLVEPIYACLPLMPEVERWMNGPGRDVLLDAINRSTREEDDPPIAVLRVLGELREPRAITPLLGLLEQHQSVTEREQARYVGVLCDTLGRLGDRRAVPPMQQLLFRSVAVEQRASLPKRRENLPLDDDNVTGSIIYGSVVRAFGLLGAREMLDTALRATSDFDPYVRIQGVEAVKRLDPSAEDLRSLLMARELLNDPADGVTRAASQLLVQYRDRDSISLLRRVIEVRPQLAAVAYDALQQLER